MWGFALESIPSTFPAFLTEENYGWENLDELSFRKTLVNAAAEMQWGFTVVKIQTADNCSEEIPDCASLYELLSVIELLK